MPFTCKSCKADFKHQTNLSRHKKTCSTSTRKDSLKVHICKNKQSKQCEICAKDFQSVWHRKRHIALAHTKPTLLNCVACERTFGTKTGLKNHSKVCKNRQSYTNSMLVVEKPSDIKGEIQFPQESDELFSSLIDISMLVHLGSSDSDPGTTVEPEQVTLTSDAVDSDIDLNVTSYQPLQINQSSMSTPNRACQELQSEQVYATPKKSVIIEEEKKLPITPNTRQKKSRSAGIVSEFLDDANFKSLNDELDVLLLVAKQCGLTPILKNYFIHRPTKNAGRKLTLLETRQKVWALYHAESSPSTITNRPAKLKLTNRSRIQSDLTFMDSVQITENKRKIKFYESIWMILNKTIRELLFEFNNSNPSHLVSWGTFLSLKPFYVRSATTGDIEMCCCKLHLHGRWSITSLIECAVKQHIKLEFDDYKLFFEYLTSECRKEETTYINWDCSSDSKTTCHDIINKWESMNKYLLDNSNSSFTVKMIYFKIVTIATKKNQEVECLKPITENVNMNFIIIIRRQSSKDIIRNKPGLAKTAQHAKTPLCSLLSILWRMLF